MREIRKSKKWEVKRTKYEKVMNTGPGLNLSLIILFILDTKRPVIMGKTMCKLSVAEKLEKRAGGELKYMCKKCGEKARKEKHLCKPKEI